MTKYSRKLIGEKEYYATVLSVNATDIGPALARTSENLNSKISGLLTHISIMIAILSLFLAQMGNFQNYDFFTYAITLEIILYLIFAIGCLRGLFITGPGTFRGDDSNALDRVVMILRLRRRIYLLSLKGTILVTIAFLITLAERVFFHNHL